MACYEQPGTRQLQDHLLATYRGTWDLGICAPWSVTDSGAPSPHQLGMAGDLGIGQDERGYDGSGEQAFWWLYASRYACGLDQIRWWPDGARVGRIWTLTRDSEGVRDDVNIAGSSAILHKTHVHWSQTWPGARGETAWYLPSEPAPAPPVPSEPEPEEAVLAITPRCADVDLATVVPPLVGRTPGYTLDRPFRRVVSHNWAPLWHPGVEGPDPNGGGGGRFYLPVDVLNPGGFPTTQPLEIGVRWDGELIVLMDDGGTLTIPTSA